MAASELTFEEIYDYFKQKGGTVSNSEVVRHFKPYLTHQASKDDARTKFKSYINVLAQTKTEGTEKLLILRPKYRDTGPVSTAPALSPVSPYRSDLRNSVGIPISPTYNSAGIQTPPRHSKPRQPPPYRPPPPPVSPPDTSDTISISSSTFSFTETNTPQAPPRRKSTEKGRSSFDGASENGTSNQSITDSPEDNQEKTPVSVKERMQKFNRMASVEDELSPSPRQQKEKKKTEKGAGEDDGASDTSLEQKKCQEWYVLASKGDYHQLVKLAKDEPRFVNLKTVLHWAAKQGNEDIIKTFAGTYHANVNAKTGYTPLHIAAQFGHQRVYDLLANVYKANKDIRDFSGHKPIYYQTSSLKNNNKDLHRKGKSRKKQSDKDMGFLRIGSLNVRVKKTTEAFSNFLGVGGASINPLDSMPEKVHKGWGSVDNITQDDIMPAPKGYTRRKSKRALDVAGVNSTPSTPKQSTRSIEQRHSTNDSDSDTAAGFDSNWNN